MKTFLQATQPTTMYGLDMPYNKPVLELVEATRGKPPICWNAYTALGYNTSEEAIAALLTLLDNPDWTHVRAAIEAIGKNANGLKLENEVMLFLNNDNEFITITAIRSLASLNCIKAHDKIKSHISNKNDHIKQAAIEALSVIWQAPDFDSLLALDKYSHSDRIKKTIGFVLAEHADESNWKKFFDHYHSSKSATNRYWCLLLACRFSNNRAMVESFLQDKNGHIRKRAEMFLNSNKELLKDTPSIPGD